MKGVIEMRGVQTFLLCLLLVWSVLIIFFNFSPVFFEQPIDDKQRAFENIEHMLIDHNKDTIVLNSHEVKLLLKKSRSHYLSEWRSKFSHFLMAGFVFLASGIFLIGNSRRNKDSI